MMPSFLADLLGTQALAALAQVVMIDLVLAGDNAVVVGLAAAGLAPERRAAAMTVGIVAATLLRLALAFVATELLRFIGLLLAGGIVLLIVCWRMARDIRELHRPEPDAAKGTATPPRKTFARAVWQIVVADVSMSLDNVLAIAGAAREHPAVLMLGLVLSVGLMGLAANLVARLITRHVWIAYAGLAVIVYVALDMIYHGALEVWAST